MKAMKFFTVIALAMMSVFTITSCDNDNDVYWYYPPYPNALVTVKPVSDNGFYLQLDDSTTLFPTNMKTSPYGDKEVRALVCFTEVKPVNSDYTKSVEINWMDSILTKKGVPYPGEEGEAEYGEDPIEIVKDWVNIAEDGYLTLRFRTRWGNNGVAHFVNLFTGVNPDDPYEVEFRHNAFGDVNGVWGDALVAFRLSDLPDTEGKTVKLTLKYKSFSGEKSIQFDYCSRKAAGSTTIAEKPAYSSRVK